MPGSAVPCHTHHHHVATIHAPPAEGDPPIITELFGEEMLVEAGQVIYIPPNAEHAVPIWEGKHPRLSFALAVDPDDNRQVIKDVLR